MAGEPFGARERNVEAGALDPKVNWTSAALTAVMALSGAKPDFPRRGAGGRVLTL